MPRICEFFGVVIYMYYNDHRPPHFHAEYAEHEALFTIARNSAPIGSEPDKGGRSRPLNHWIDQKESQYATPGSYPYR